MLFVYNAHCISYLLPNRPLFSPHVKALVSYLSFFLFLFFYHHSYRIRLPTEKELEMKVSKDVKKMRFYESTLLSAYKVGALPFDYIQSSMPNWILEACYCICFFL